MLYGNCALWHLIFLADPELHHQLPCLCELWFPSFGSFGSLFLSYHWGLSITLPQPGGSYLFSSLYTNDPPCSTLSDLSPVVLLSSPFFLSYPEVSYTFFFWIFSPAFLFKIPFPHLYWWISHHSFQLIPSESDSFLSISFPSLCVHWGKIQKPEFFSIFKSLSEILIWFLLINKTQKISAISNQYWNKFQFYLLRFI